MLDYVPAAISGDDGPGSRTENRRRSAEFVRETGAHTCDRGTRARLMAGAADNLVVTERFYAALAAADPRALVELLDPGFHAELTEGLPEEWGGVYTTARDMLDRCWGPIFRVLDSRPVPQECLPCGPDRIVVLGRYQGRHRQTGRVLDAAFVHVLGLAGGRIRSLRQVTDSARWRVCVIGEEDETC